MTDFLQSTFGVATGGVKWDSGQFKLWQSTNPDVILFCPKQAVLAKGSDGRYLASVTTYNQQLGGVGGEEKITGGSATVSFTSAIDFDEQEFERLQEQWRAEYHSKGGTSRNPKFVALPLQKGKARAVMLASQGKFLEEHAERSVGTAGGQLSYVIDLTELGAQTWAQALKKRKGVEGAVQMEYQYLQFLPPVGAKVTLNGRRLFRHFSTALDVSYDGLFYGGSAQIDLAWEKMTRDGTIKIEFIGTTDDPEIDRLRNEIVTAFSEQAQKQWFDILFQPKPDVKPAEAGDSGGWFGGANFALKWRREEEAVNLALELSFQGWTHMSLSMDMPFTELQKLDGSYLNEVYTQRQIEANVIVDPDPQLQTAAISWSASEGKAPEAPIFSETGGVKTYVITSNNPEEVMVRYRARIGFQAPWPVIDLQGAAKVKDGGNQVYIRTSPLVGRHEIYMFVRDGDRILSPLELSLDDYIIANVSYEGAHLGRRSIKQSAMITPMDILEFSYPINPDPNGAVGVAKFSAIGVLGGKLVRASSQVINLNEAAVFILADKTTKQIQLVSENSILPESDSLAQSLLASKGQALVRTIEAAPSTTIEEEPSTPSQPGSVIDGTLVAVEYSQLGASLVIQENGSFKRAKLRHVNEADPFDDEGRKHLKVKLDERGEYAESILVVLDS
ncbi:MAG: hypothetical protein F6K14_08835 [Symploca sp. SIO2C1]|nr:hypothetical protein [Symploca sp. SIO2C1]